MINLIYFSDKFTGIDWFFNHSKQSFIHPDKADLTYPDFFTEDLFVPEYIGEIALNEFKCTEDYLDRALGIVVHEF